MVNYQYGGLLEEFVIVGGLIGAKALHGIHAVLMSLILSAGVKPLSVATINCLIHLFLISPLAIALERKRWPKRLSQKVVMQILLVSIGGPAAIQMLMLMGVKKTSPTMASIVPNLVPGLVFIIASFLRFEKVNIRCPYSRAKMGGTLMCLAGAVTMSLVSAPEVPPTSSVTPHQRLFLFSNETETRNYDWVLGCFYLLLGVIVVSSTVVMEAAIMVEFPAPLSLCAMGSLIGAGLTAALQVIYEGSLDASFLDHGIKLVLYVLLGGIMTGTCLAFQSWAVKKRGPVLVTMFNPIITVAAVILAALTLGQFINMASLTGMLILFAGLYVVLWAKNKEGCKLSDDAKNKVLEVDDIEKPLFS